jgi:hypothetical protein
MAIDFIEKAISSFSLCQTTKTKTKTCHTFVLFFITVLASLFLKNFLDGTQATEHAKRKRVSAWDLSS